MTAEANSSDAPRIFCPESDLLRRRWKLKVKLDGLGCGSDSDGPPMRHGGRRGEQGGIESRFQTFEGEGPIRSSRRLLVAPLPTAFPANGLNGNSDADDGFPLRIQHPSANFCCVGDCRPHEKNDYA